MTKMRSNSEVKKWAVAFTASFSSWLVLFVLVTSNVFPFSRCESWEGEPYASYCDAPYWDGWDALPIWLGVLAFILAVATFVKLIYAQGTERSKKRK